MNFVTQIDNMTYPDAEKYWQDSDRTVLGLQRFMNLDQLRKFFAHIKKEPHEKLTDDELRSLELKPMLSSQVKNERDQWKTRLPDRSEQQKKVIEATDQVIKEAKKQGSTIESEKYGKILVLINRSLPGGFMAAKAYGFGAMVYYNREDNSCFVSTAEPLEEEFSQGLKVRKRMWIKPRHDPAPLDLSLTEILVKMAGRDAKIGNAIANQVKEEVKAGRFK